MSGELRVMVYICTIYVYVHMHLGCVRVCLFMCACVRVCVRVCVCAITQPYIISKLKGWLEFTPPKSDVAN